jgi:hypothetical protein
MGPDRSTAQDSWPAALVYVAVWMTSNRRIMMSEDRLIMYDKLLFKMKKLTTYPHMPHSAIDAS